VGALLRSIAQVLRQTLGCDFVVVSIPDFEAGQMSVLALDFPESRRAFREGARVPIEGSVVGEVFRSRRRRLISDPNDLDPIIRARATTEGIAEGCFCPLVHQDRALGVMSAGWRDKGALQRRHRRNAGCRRVAGRHRAR
jgi:transcriptional regulator with GAF, ATPase, and Fis domain